MGYGATAVVDQPWQSVVGLVRDALTEQGFEVLTELDLRATLQNRLGVDLPPQVVLGVSCAPLAYAALAVCCPEILDVLRGRGRVLGRHEGLIHFTVGQRRGLAVATGERLYVVRLERERLWAGFDAYSEGPTMEEYSRRRARRTPVIVLEPLDRS